MVTLIALALVTVAVAASVAEADSLTQTAGTTVDPLAVSMLLGKGYTQPQIKAWTVGSCSHEQKPAACYGPSKGAIPTGAAATVDPLATSYLIGQGLTPSEITSWTVGDCSHVVKSSSCYAMFTPTVTLPAATTGFSWGDAGVGAAATLGIVLLLGGLGAALISRHNHRPPMARA